MNIRIYGTNSEGDEVTYDHEPTDLYDIELVVDKSGLKVIYVDVDGMDVEEHYYTFEHNNLMVVT